MVAIIEKSGSSELIVVSFAVQQGMHCSFNESQKKDKTKMRNHMIVCVALLSACDPSSFAPIEAPRTKQEQRHDSDPNGGESASQMGERLTAGSLKHSGEGPECDDGCRMANGLKDRLDRECMPLVRMSAEDIVDDDSLSFAGVEQRLERFGYCCGLFLGLKGEARERMGDDFETKRSEMEQRCDAFDGELKALGKEHFERFEDEEAYIVCEWPKCIRIEVTK